VAKGGILSLREGVLMKVGGPSSRKVVLSVKRWLTIVGWFHTTQLFDAHINVEIANSIKYICKYVKGN
jgi:hypothetical protein